MTTATPQRMEGHLLTARSASTLALVFRKWPGAAARAGTTPEDLELEVERAIARAEILQPTNALVQLEAAAAMLTVARQNPHGDSYVARATLRLEAAVRLDPWRASNAYSMVDTLSDAQLDRIAYADPRVLHEAGRAWRRRGQGDRSLASFEAAHRLDATYPPALFSLGQSAVERGDDEAAEGFLRGFLAQTDGNSTLEGWAYLWLGQPAPAEKRFERSVQVQADNAWIQYGYGQALRANGHNTEAREAFQAVLQIDPGHIGASAALSVLTGRTFHDRSL